MALDRTWRGGGTSAKATINTKNEREHGRPISLAQLLRVYVQVSPTIDLIRDLDRFSDRSFIPVTPDGSTY